MAFNFDTWKTQFREHIKDWKPRMQRAGVNSVYAFISAATLWPVLQAYQQEGLLAVALTLGQVVGSVGGNLIANQIQSWKDKTEAEAAQQLVELVASDEDLRAALDKVLEKLEALLAAQQGLREGDQQWFVQTIQKELANLGSSVRYEAILTGGGAIAQGVGATAVGAGGSLVEGGVGGDYIAPGGTKVVHPDPREIATGQQDRSRQRYLECLRRHCQALPLAALGGEEGATEDVTLDSIYIHLDTKTQIPLTEDEKKERSARAYSGGRDEETKLLPVLEAAQQAARLALLGDPGAGKSTFVRKLLAWQAAAILWDVRPPPGFSTNLLPILIVLRDLSQRLSLLELEAMPAEKQQASLLAAFRGHIIEDLSSYDAADFAGPMMQVLHTGECILALDGLDEVPQDLRGRVRQVVSAVIRQYGPERVIITCRVRSYVGEAVLPDFQTHTLAPFDEDKIRAFCSGWYNAQKELGRVGVRQAENRARNLTRAALADELRELSSNPMMLTTMAIIHQQEIGLPSERVRLYSLAVDVLARRWQKLKTGERGMVPSDALAAFLKDDLRLRPTLERLAYEAHSIGHDEEGAADLPRGQALILLEAPEYLGDAGLVGEFLDYVDQRTGLLVGRGGEPGRPTSYSFPHRIFQEYLAGCYLAGKRNIVRAYFASAAEGDYWNLAAQLGAEELLYNRRGTNALLDLAYSLCTEPDSEQNERALLWSGNMAALVGREVVERDTGSPEGGKVYLERLLSRLVKTLSGRLAAPERADAGRVLAKLGDPRLEVTTLEAMQFCWVPAGPFRMGSDKNLDPDAFDHEQPQHEVHLPGYWISRYPVTNAQYDQFMQDGGYKRGKYWPEAEGAEVWQDGFITGRFDDEPRDHPSPYRDPFNLPNHPVVGVTWYEALAFTRWLTERWRQQGCLAKGWAAHLPSEGEWEKAARGGLQISSAPVIRAAGEGFMPVQVEVEVKENQQTTRRFPWEGDFDSDKANTGETGIGATSAVGCFPGGASPYGVMDLSGNVWEWTCSLVVEYPYPGDEDKRAERETLNASKDVLRVLRGGAFSSNRGLARCAYRSWHYPVVWFYNSGFRVVVVSPFQL